MSHAQSLLSIPISVPGCATVRRPRIALKPPPARTHFRFGLPSTAPSIGEGHATVPSGHAQRAHFKSASRHNRATAATYQYPIGVPLVPPTHTSRAATHPPQPTTSRYDPPNSSTHGHYNPHTTTHTSQPPIHSPTSTAHTLHHQHPIGQPYNPTQTHPDRPIQPTRPKTASSYP